MLAANYSGFSQPSADGMRLLSGVERRFGNLHRGRWGEGGFALREPGQHRRPGRFHRALKMNRLHANKRQRAVARQQAGGTRTGRELAMLLQNPAQPGFFTALKIRECDELTVENLFRVGAQNVGETSGHTGAEIQAERTQYQDHAARHIFATVLADSLDNGKRATIANSEAFAGAAHDKELAGCGAVQNGVSRENITAPRATRPCRNRNRSPGQAFSDIVVGFPVELEGDAVREEGAKTLACRAVIFLRDFWRHRVKQRPASHDLAAEMGADTAVGISNSLRFTGIRGH